jgi:hypothetical protein
MRFDKPEAEDFLKVCNYFHQGNLIYEYSKSLKLKPLPSVLAWRFFSVATRWLLTPPPRSVKLRES